MTVKSSKNKNASIAFAIVLISLVIIALNPVTFFSKSKNETNLETIINQTPKPSALQASSVVINQTDSLNLTNPYGNFSAASKTDPASVNTQSPAVYDYPDMSGFSAFLLDNTVQGQVAGSYVTVPTYASDINAAAPISLNASDFVTYTYGGYSVQQPDYSQFNFSFPDSTDQGQLAGSDAVTLNTYAIQKIDFDAAFTASNISALGFDEMTIFAASNTTTYKGTEFGVRMDLQDGFIYGYVQEPNGFGDVDFQMQQLMPNDGAMHHYALIMWGSGVSFWIDGTDYGYLNFASGTDYSGLSFSICAAVHRFTDGWESSGDNMVVGNFALNQS
ncbi:MAG: hypothetical protein ABSF44_12755 [Candidatus Bathyarchaeia archaeon]|jgi:hypothetical protein